MKDIIWLSPSLAAWIGLAVFFGVPLLTILLITVYLLPRPAKAFGNQTHAQPHSRQRPKLGSGSC